MQVLFYIFTQSRRGVLLCGFSLLILCGAFGQSRIKIKGKIENLEADRVYIEILDQVSGELKEKEVKLDSTGYFEYSDIASGYPYVNINIGYWGAVNLLVRAGDAVYFLMDYQKPDSSLFISGLGARKWQFQHEASQRFANYDYLISQSKDQNFNEYVKISDSLYQNQLEFLEKNKEDLNPEFYLLFKADLIGQKNKWISSYGLNNNVPLQEIKSKLEFLSVSPERQANSYQFNRFYDNYIELQKLQRNHQEIGILSEMEFVRNLFLYGDIERPVAESRINMLFNSFMETRVYTSEMEKAWQFYKEEVRNPKFLALVETKVDRSRKLKNGFDLPYGLEIFQNSQINEKALKKRNHLLYFYDSECIPCEDDFQYFEVTSNNFEKKEKLQLTTIYTPKTNSFISEFSSENIISLKASSNSIFYSSDSPQIYLITRDLKVYGDLPSPSLDEGRSLIEAIRNIISTSQ